VTRYLVPAAFVAATIWVSWYNAGHADSKVMVPLVDVIFPAAAGNPQKLGERSVQVMAGVSAFLFLLAVTEHVRALRRQPE
jgi:hypothetical protein